MAGALHEKGSKRHEMPAHHNPEEYLAAYIEAAGMAKESGTPLFRTARGKTGRAHRPADVAAGGVPDGSAPRRARASRRRLETIRFVQPELPRT